MDNEQDFAGAIEAYKKLVALQPDGTGIMVAIGNDYLLLKDWQKGLYWGRKASQGGSGQGPGLVLMAEAYSKAVDAAADDPLKYDDRLVYLIAHGLYQRASKSSDARAVTNGKNGMALLEGNDLIPLMEHWFQHQGEKRPQKNAYKWIEKDWPEVQYIDQYLKQFGQ